MMKVAFFLHFIVVENYVISTLTKYIATGCVNLSLVTCHLTAAPTIFDIFSSSVFVCNVYHLQYLIYIHSVAYIKQHKRCLFVDITMKKLHSGLFRLE